ncbi:type I methionyl aminopeptidase [Helcobacillus massiliensis]|uniref:type I methionyl aminopeptidase n=1 Tax=Helcobacillus massiliensis TaxID=521392 RepID=UPI0021A4A62D|nr:type I methionyl aminopeptidase [Helcobacillus massiliensis]MCT1556946.1 type I methionyl aminopeptidase [Helcobacillus massiliensis]MCT2035335.1 type I methionyl aminopeptidase [Helcobacillus massiliensis]MCT2331450.1 type I methionyl aminopeptidase [Helcobacillus massiliensis]
MLRRRRPRTERPTPEQLRPAGEFVAGVLSHLRTVVEPGMNLLEIDAEAHRLIREAGAASCYLDYHPSFGGSPFGHVICTSVNEAVLHGRPYDRALADGDLLSLDFAVELDGWVADSCLSISVGEQSDAHRRLIQDTEDVMWAGIDAAVAGARVGDIGHAVESRAHALGYSINTRFGGHGVGRTMHEEPFIPNWGQPGTGQRLEAGMAITVEPFLSPTTASLFITERDGWTVETDDGSTGAHAEHTLIVTDGAPIILTGRADDPSPRSSIA